MRWLALAFPTCFLVQRLVKLEELEVGGAWILVNEHRLQYNYILQDGDGRAGAERGIVWDNRITICFVSPIPRTCLVVGDLRFWLCRVDTC